MLSNEQQQLLLDFFEKLEDHQYDDLLVILAQFQSLYAINNNQAYENFIENISVYLIDKLHQEYNKDVISAIEIFNALQKNGINRLLSAKYLNDPIIEEIQLLMRELQSGNEEFTALSRESVSSSAPMPVPDNPSLLKSSEVIATKHPITFTNSSSSMKNISAKSVEEILKEIENLLGVSRNIGVDSTIELHPRKVIELLDKIKQTEPEKFQKLLTLKGWEGNTLLLTALSLEHLGLAEYLLNNQATINVVNDFGINPLHMLAMVHIDHNKYAIKHAVFEPRETEKITIDHLPSEPFNQKQIKDRLQQVQNILRLMREKDPKYFQANINQTREPSQLYQETRRGSSNPLAKVIAYAKEANYLEDIIQVWQSFGAEKTGNISLAKYVLGTHDLDFVLKCNELFPGSFSYQELNKATKNHTTVMEEFIFSEIPMQLKFATINAIKKINHHHSAEILGYIQNTCNNKLPQVLRNQILMFISGSNLGSVLQNPKEFLANLHENKDWLRLIAIYDQGANSQQSITKFLDGKINDVKSFSTQNETQIQNKSIITQHLEDLKNHLTHPHHPNEEETILQKYSHDKSSKYGRRY